MDEQPWKDYYERVRSREPRDTLVAALAAFDRDDATAGPGAVRPQRSAVDLACGDGTDTLALLAAGWIVTAIDASPDFPEFLLGRVPPALTDRVTLQVADFRSVTLPECDLVHAGFALFFCPPDDFDGLWARIRASLRPGARIACHLLGPRDTWAQKERALGAAAMSWHTRGQVDRLLDGLEVERLEETAEDGWSYAGEKFWHLWRILARRPA